MTLHQPAPVERRFWGLLWRSFIDVQGQIVGVLGLVITALAYHFTADTMVPVATTLSRPMATLTAWLGSRHLIYAAAGVQLAAESPKSSR